MGPTKFQRAPQFLAPNGVITVKGVEIDLQGNSQQTLITSESSPNSGGVFMNLANTSVSFFIAGRIGLEGRVPNYALIQRDAPFIYTEIVSAIGSDGRDTRARVRVSVDKTWHPNAPTTGTTHFNEIRIYRRDYADPERRFQLTEGGFMPITGQLEGFLLSGSSTWPGTHPLPAGDSL